MAADRSDERIEADGTLGRNDFPCFHIGVTYAFFHIFEIVQNFVCQKAEFSSIGRVRLGNGVFISLPKQIDDLCVFHEVHILSFCSSP